MPGAPRPPRWARAADAIGVVLLAFALAVWISGGFVVRPAGLRLSFTSEWRIAAWAVGIIALRHALFRRQPLPHRLASGLRAAMRSQAALPHDDIVESTLVRSRGRAFAAGLAVVVLFWGLTLAMTYPQVLVLDRGVSIDIGDPLLSTWRLAWFAHQLPRDPLHLFDGNIFYPAKGTLAFSDAMLVPSLMGAPLLWLGAHQLLVTNLVLLSGFALSGAAMFLLVRALTGHVGAALVSGFVFAFLPYRYMHYAHLELQMAQWMPVCLWAVHRTAQRGRLRDGLLVGLFLALQTLSSLYYGIFFATFLVPVVIALLGAAPPGRLTPALKALAAGTVLAAALIAPAIKPYFAAREAVGERRLEEVGFYSAQPQDYLVAHPRNTIYGPLSKGLGAQERELFMGFAVPLIAAAALWPPISAVRMGYAVALALAFELSLGTNGLLYPWLREYLLPFRGLRVPARMAILVGLSLSVLVGFAVARIARACTSRAARVSAVVALALPVVGEYHSTLTLRNVWRSPPPIYASLADQPDAVLLELPLIAPDITLEPVYMYFSTFHWHPLVNGYSGFSPPAYFELREMLTRFPDDESVAALRRRNVDYLIVHQALSRPGAYLELIERLAQRPDLPLVRVMRWERGDSRLYRVAR